jgi:hypothetical protein
LHLPRGTANTARRHRDWLREVVRQSGLKPTRLAKELKIAPSTLTRPLKEGEDGTSTLHAATIEKISAFTGIAGPGAAAPRRTARGLAEEALPYRAEQAGDPLDSAVQALIGGRNGVDPWTLKTRALELLGYLPGDVVLVDLNAEAKPGDAVCAQIYDWTRMRAETIMRVLERAGPVEVLLARSLDPTLQQVVAVDGEQVMVKGVILPHRLRAAA